jgi:Leucine Rich repeat
LFLSKDKIAFMMTSTVNNPPPTRKPKPRGIHVYETVTNNFTDTTLQSIECNLLFHGSSFDIAAKLNTTRNECTQPKIMNISFNQKNSICWLGIGLLIKEIQSSLTLVGIRIHDCNTNVQEFELTMIRKIIASLVVNASVSFLDVSNNMLGYEELDLLLNVLLCNNHIQQLYLRDSMKLDNDKKKVVTLGQRMSDVLQRNNMLQKIDLSKNADLGNEFFIELASGLRTNASLKTLDLSHCSISDDVAIAIADALLYNTSLLSLCLSCNKISDEGTKKLGDMLRINKILQTVDLDGNSIGDVGATALANGLYWNTTLLQFSLHNNNISAPGAQAIAKAIRYQTSIKRFALGKNPLTDVGIESIIDALKCNNVLSGLHLIGVTFSPELCMRLTNYKDNEHHFLNYNNTLEKLACDYHDIEFALIMQREDKVGSKRKGCGRRDDISNWLSMTWFSSYTTSPQQLQCTDMDVDDYIPNEKQQQAKRQRVISTADTSAL